MNQRVTPPMIKVWDLPVRIFHWSLVGLFVFLIISGDLGDELIEWHFYAGYLLSGLILFRLVWGLVGSQHARFTAFVRHPLETLRYSRRMLTGKAEHHYGHNPAGGMMVVVLLLLLGLQVASGLVTSDDILWDGPFYSAVSDELADLGGRVHHQLQLVLKVLVGLHILAIVFHRLAYKEKLVPAMIHGKKVNLDGISSADRAGVLPFVLAAGLAAGWVYYLFGLPL